MSMSRTGLAAVIVAAAVIVTACSAAGAAPAASPASTGSPSGAPPVAAPLDASRFLAQPCSVLSTAQLATFGVPAAGQPDTGSQPARATGPSCTWRGEGQHPRGIEVGFLTGNKHGLADTYRDSSRTFPGYFVPTQVDGYPAVFN